MLECLKCTRRWIESDVLFKSGKMDQIAFQSERGYLITDPFFCVRSGRLYCGPQFSEYFLYFLREDGNILINGIKTSLTAFHEFSYFGTRSYSPNISVMSRRREEASSSESEAILDPRRVLLTARIWSTAISAGRPSHRTGSRQRQTG